MLMSHSQAHDQMFMLELSGDFSKDVLGGHSGIIPNPSML